MLAPQAALTGQELQQPLPVRALSPSHQRDLCSELRRETGSPLPRDLFISGPSTAP